MIQLVAIVLLGAVALLVAPHAEARTEGGDLLWQSDFDLGGGEDLPAALAAANGRVVTAGTVTDIAGNTDLVVRTHHAKSGELLWQDRVDLNGLTRVQSSVVMDQQRVFVAGMGTNAAGQPQGVIRAYDGRTGRLIWADTNAGGPLFKDGHRIVSTGGSHVRGHVARTGVIAWEWTKEPPQLPPGYSGGGGGIVAITADRLFMASSVLRSVPTPAFECFVQAHDLESGLVLWQTIHNLSGSGFCFPGTIASDGRRVVIGGVGGAISDDYFVLAFDADTGEFAWQDHQAIGNNELNVAMAIDIEGRRTFVAGRLDVPNVGGAGTEEAYVVRSYDTETGTLRWHDERHDTSSGFINWRALDVEAEGRRVFAVGQNVTVGTWLVRAYDARQGTVLWEDEFQPAGGFNDSGPEAIAVDGGRVFVAGSAAQSGGQVDFILRAYDAR
jgi:outer membrane protein assembly factor BamB